MPSHLSILVYGHDPILLETRRLVLEHAGFQVFTVRKQADAEKLAAAEPIDLFLLCHTISGSDRTSTLANVLAIQPTLKILLITTIAGEVPPGRWGTVDGLAGAAKMIEAARKAIGEKQRA